MRKTAKAALYRLPLPARLFFRRALFAYRMRTGTFVSPEPEFARLDEFVSKGDWVIDVGANVGHYTTKLSTLVGDSGRVIAFEPWPETFALLVANCMRLTRRNVTLLNLAVSDRGSLASMGVPLGDDGIPDPYLARLSAASEAPHSVLSCVLDSIEFPQRIGLIKLDVEGHEERAVAGMDGLLKRDRPLMIVENATEATRGRLTGMGYRESRHPRSPNSLFRAD